MTDDYNRNRIVQGEKENSSVAVINEFHNFHLMEITCKEPRHFFVAASYSTHHETFSWNHRSQLNYHLTLRTNGDFMILDAWMSIFRIRFH